MKPTSLQLLLAAAIGGHSALGFVIIPDSPDLADQHQAPIAAPQQQHHNSNHGDAHGGSWWDSVASVFEESSSFVEATLEKVAHAVEELKEQIPDTIEVTGGHDHRDTTIYDFISNNKYTKKFAKLVDKYPDVADILKDTNANYTLFVPGDEAFEDIPDHHDKPSKEFVEAVLKYHIGIGEYPARRILTTHTLPTAYDESWLGGEPQRLRTSVGLGGVRVNFYSKVVPEATDIVRS